MSSKDNHPEHQPIEGSSNRQIDQKKRTLPDIIRRNATQPGVADSSVSVVNSHINKSFSAPSDIYRVIKDIQDSSGSSGRASSEMENMVHRFKEDNFRDLQGLSAAYDELMYPETAQHALFQDVRKWDEFYQQHPEFLSAEPINFREQHDRISQEIVAIESRIASGQHVMMDLHDQHPEGVASQTGEGVEEIRELEQLQRELADKEAIRDALQRFDPEKIHLQFPVRCREMLESIEAIHAMDSDTDKYVVLVFKEDAIAYLETQSRDLDQPLKTVKQQIQSVVSQIIEQRRNPIPDQDKTLLLTQQFKEFQNQRQPLEIQQQSYQQKIADISASSFNFNIFFDDERIVNFHEDIASCNWKLEAYELSLQEQQPGTTMHEALIGIIQETSALKRNKKNILEKMQFVAKNRNDMQEYMRNLFESETALNMQRKMIREQIMQNWQLVGRINLRDTLHRISSGSAVTGETESDSPDRTLESAQSLLEKQLRYDYAVSLMLKNIHEQQKTCVDKIMGGYQYYEYFLKNHVFPCPSDSHYSIRATPEVNFTCVPTAICDILSDFDPEYKESSKYTAVPGLLKSPLDDGGFYLTDAPDVMKILGHPIEYRAYDVRGVSDLLTLAKKDERDEMIPMIIRINRPDNLKIESHAIVIDHIKLEKDGEIIFNIRDPYGGMKYSVTGDALKEVLNGTIVAPEQSLTEYTFQDQEHTLTPFFSANDIAKIHY